jgi:hypothetical protein
MKKILLLATFLLLAYVNIVYAKAPAMPPAINSLSMKNTGKIKFGPHVGTSFLLGTIGASVEYKLNEKLGVQIGMLYCSNICLLHAVTWSRGRSALAGVSYIKLPILVRAYPGSSRQFCWFGGLQVGYLVGGRLVFMDEKYLHGIYGPLKSPLDQEVIKFKDINEQGEVRKLQWGIVAGFDYEFIFGLIVGLTYTKDFVDVVKTGRSDGNWSLRPTLGYNFGRFLQN